LVGIVVANLYMASPFSLETLAQIASFAASIATLIALGIAIKSLNTWKSQHRATRLDNRFYELTCAYKDASAAFYKYYFKKVAVLKAKHSFFTKFSVEKAEELRRLESESQNLDAAFLEALSLYHRQYYFIRNSLNFLKTEELVELENIQAGWYEALNCVDDTDIDVTNYPAVNYAEKLGYKVLKNNTAAAENLLTTIENKVEKQFT